MIVRRALKSPLVVPGGGAIDMDLSQYLRCAAYFSSVPEVRCIFQQCWQRLLKAGAPGGGARN